MPLKKVNLKLGDVLALKDEKTDAINRYEVVIGIDLKDPEHTQVKFKSTDGEPCASGSVEIHINEDGYVQSFSNAGDYYLISRISYE